MSTEQTNTTRKPLIQNDNTAGSIAAVPSHVLSPLEIDSARMRHFHTLDREHQAEAIRRLAADDLGERTIAQATGLTVEMIRRILAEPRA